MLKTKFFTSFFTLICYNHFMKLKPRLSRIILPYLVIYLALVIASYFIVGFSFPPTLSHYLITGLWTGGFAILTFMGVKYNSYEIHKNHIIHHKGFGKITYEFDSILYIDETYSRKHKTLLFYTDKGDERFLALDKKNILLEKTLERSKKCVSKAEFTKRFPRVKL